MNRGPRAPGPPSSGATNFFLGKTLRKIIKIVATRSRILRLKCTKFDFDCMGLRLQRSPRPTYLDLGAASLQGKGLG